MKRQRKKNYSGKKSDEDKLFFLSHRRNLESGFEETKLKIILEKNAEHKAFTVSSPQSGIRFEQTKGKIVPEKRVMKINPSLSHRRNLESGLETKKEKLFWKKER